VIVERRGDRLFEPARLDRLPRQFLDQDRGRIDETRRAVAALEAEVLEKRLLNRRKRDDRSVLVALCTAFHGANRLAVEEVRGGDARAHFLARSVRLVENDDARVANTLPASQTRAGEVEIFMQEVDEHQRGRHLKRAHRPAVDRQGDRFRFDAGERTLGGRSGLRWGRAHASTS
jgi:hypothetical protein